jgi:hypothetical protein
LLKLKALPSSIPRDCHGDMRFVAAIPRRSL